MVDRAFLCHNLVAVGTFYKEALWLALKNTPSLVGSTWLGVGFTLCLFLATYFLSIRDEPWWKRARGWRQRVTAMQEHWIRRVGNGMTVVLIGWSCLYLVSLAKTFYQEHIKAQYTIVALRGKVKGLEEERRPNAHHKAYSSRAALTPRRLSVKAQNGIAIGGNNLGSATVNNTFSDVYPHPGVVPNVNFCIPGPTANVFTVTTDTAITSPFWGFIFDGPVVKGIVEMEDSSHEPFGWSDGHPKGWVMGQLTDPLGTLPEDSRLFINAQATTRPYSDDVLRIQITEIGPPFGGPYRPGLAQMLIFDICGQLS